MADGREPGQQDDHQGQQRERHEREQRNPDDRHDEQDHRDDERRDEGQLDQQANQARLEGLGGGALADPPDRDGSHQQQDAGQHDQDGDVHRGACEPGERSHPGKPRGPLDGASAGARPAEHGGTDADVVHAAVDDRAGIALQGAAHHRDVPPHAGVRPQLDLPANHHDFALHLAVDPRRPADHDHVVGDHLVGSDHGIAAESHQGAGPAVAAPGLARGGLRRRRCRRPGLRAQPEQRVLRLRIEIGELEHQVGVRAEQPAQFDAGHLHPVDANPVVGQARSPARPAPPWF